MKKRIILLTLSYLPFHSHAMLSSGMRSVASTCNLAIITSAPHAIQSQGPLFQASSSSTTDGTSPLHAHAMFRPNELIDLASVRTISFLNPQTEEPLKIITSKSSLFPDSIINNQPFLRLYSFNDSELSIEELREKELRKQYEKNEKKIREYEYKSDNSKDLYSQLIAGSAMLSSSVSLFFSLSAPSLEDAVFTAVVFTLVGTGTVAFTCLPVLAKGLSMKLCAKYLKNRNAKIKTSISARMKGKT